MLCQAQNGVTPAGASFDSASASQGRGGGWTVLLCPGRRSPHGNARTSPAASESRRL